MITELRSLWQEAFGDPEAFMDDFFSVAYDESRCRTVRKDGKTVSALYWFDVDMGTQRLAYLYGVATLNAYRGQGIAAYLIEKTCKELQEKGYSGVLLVPGSARLFEYYRRLSFFTGTTIAQCDCPAEGKTLLRPVSAEEYATLRRQLLPDRGVEQEGAFLELLQRQYGLFAGDGFVLCAAVNGEKAFIPEFLGDRQRLPAVVGGLGVKTAQVRMPGPGRSFSMYRPLNGAVPPLYFGLAMD